MSITHQADPTNRARLRWRARRGLLENDLILTRFLDTYESGLTDDEVEALSLLLDLSDSELLDLLLKRKEPGHEFDSANVRALLHRLQNA